MADDGYSAELKKVLDRFEKKLTDRWQDEMYDAIWEMKSWGSTPVHISTNSRVAPDVWNYRRPEVQAHLIYGCAHIDWYRQGCNGSPDSVTCPGTVQGPGHPGRTGQVWFDEEMVHVSQREIDCGVGGVFKQCAEWAKNDRELIAMYLPMWADQKISVLKSARDKLVEMAFDFGAEAKKGSGEVGDFRTEMSLSDNVDSLFLDRDAEKGWRVDWTGSAADRVAEGIFASTKPTLSNHAILANGLGTLINRRATMIHTYRENNLNLVNGAIKALDAEVEEEDDSSGLWNAMAGIGTAVAIPPSAAPAGTSILLLAWLGEQLVGSSTTVSYEHHPGDVAQNLYKEVKNMEKDLGAAEVEYAEDVRNFRENLDDVPSTFLELYDITENASTGTS